eukprot:m.429363 g.429363  ORF g.429363 m.429363 type:complete len:541 (+) comp56716_c0_seq1:316-1938(+)
MDSGTVALPDHMFAPQHLVLCCECGVPILPNPANTCVNCLRIRFDISAGIPKQSTMYHCRGCERYLHPPGTWVAATLESRELLALCLKRLRGLNKVRLVDAGFIWTEPHSKRIKVKLTIQQEIYSGTLLQQIFVVEYIINNQMCDNCHRREANDTWNAVVQVRQKVPHKKTFFFLEQLMIKHRAHQKTIKVKATPDGLDFFYASRQDAKHFCDFLQAVVPMRMKTSERLISHDIQSNISNYKFTFSVEIVPICKDDVVCLPLPISKMCGTMAQIVICDRVGSSLHFIDPLTLQREEVSGDVYWRYPFQSIMSAAKLIEYMVMDIEPVRDASGRPVVVGKYALAEVTVARERDVSANDTQFITRTHLGHFLQIGDMVLGCDLTNANFNDENADKMDPSKIPEVVLVKKSFRHKRKTHKNRTWKIKILEKEIEGSGRREELQAERDMEHFLQDLEEDKELREAVNIYKDPSAVVPAESDAEDDELKIGVDEMLDDFEQLGIADGEPDPEDVEGLPSVVRVDQDGEHNQVTIVSQLAPQFVSQ